MKLRRTLAALLTIAIVATSGSFAEVVYAEEGTVSEQVTLNADGQSAVQEPLKAQETIIQDQEIKTENTQESGLDAETDQDATADIENQDTDEAADEDNNAGDEEDSQEFDPDGQQDTDDIEAVEENADGESDEDDLAEAQEVVEEETEELLERPDVVSDSFEVDASGKLQIKSSVSTPITAESILLPQGVKTIPEGIFSDEAKVKGLKNLYFSDKLLEKIEDEAFKGNKTICHVGIDGTSVMIGREAFNNCTSLNSVALGNVTEIGEKAFYSTAIFSADLSSATKIGNEAFLSCSSLKRIIWGDGITSIGQSAFSGCALESLRLDNLTALAAGLGDLAFSGNERLTNVTLPAGLTKIPQSAFKGCTSLNHVEFPDLENKNVNMLESIGTDAFKGCSSLTEISLGANVRSVESGAFDSCTKLATIYFYKADGDVDIADNAIPARSDNKGVIRGRGGKVKAYAETRSADGWKYKALDMYKVGAFSSNAGKITPDVTEAAEGEEVYLTVVPAKGYTFTEIRVNNVPLIAEPEENLKLSSVAKQVYMFTMPAEDVAVTATAVKSADLLKGKLSWDFEPGSYGEANSSLLKFTKAGNKARIRVYNATTNTNVGLWNFNMASTDEGVAAITQFGEITALRKGTANISLTPTSGQKIVIRVSVAESEHIKSISFDDYFATDTAKSIKDATILEKNSPYNDTGYPVIEFDADAVAVADHTFSPTIVATNAGNDKLLINSSWTSSDKSIATVASAKSSLNSNTITVKKGSLGEAYIKVTTVNDDDGTTTEGGFVVRVLNSAPRMTVDSVQVNVAQSGGTILPCVPVYDYEVTSETMSVCTRKVVNGVVTYPENTMGFTAGRDASNYIRLYASNVDGKYKAKSKTTIKGTNMLYIVGKQKRGDAEVEFHMPITEVVVINELPSVKLSYSGKINLLYNKNYENADDNVVKVNLGVSNVANLLIHKIQFVTADNYKLSPTEIPADDKLENNFEVTKLLWNLAEYNTGFVVKVNDNYDTDDKLQKDTKGNVVASGYAKIWFEGYTDPVNVPISIPCAYTFPKYGLSTTKVTTSKYYKDPEYKVQIINNGVSPKQGVDLYTGDDHNVWNVAELKNDYSASGTSPSSFYNEPEKGGSEKAKDANGNDLKDPVTNKQIYKDYIKISASGTPVKSKERIALRMKDWRKPMTFDFNMAVSNAKATVKLNPSSVTMSKLITKQKAKMELSCNLADAKAQIPTYKFNETSKMKDDVKATGKLLIDAPAITFNYATDDSPANITVSLDNLSDTEIKSLVKGSYSYTATIPIKFGNYSVPENECPTVKFTVTINENKPKFGLKNTKFLLNTNYSGNGETATSLVTASNLAKGAKYEISDVSDIHLLAATKNLSNKWTGDTPTYSDDKKKITGWTDNGGWRDSFEFSIEKDDDENEILLGIRLKAGVPDSTFNYDYYLYGLKFQINGQEFELVEPIKFRLSGHEKAETVSMSTKNVLNQLLSGKISPANEKVVVSGYEAVYTYTLKNLYGSIDAVKLEEIDSTGSVYTKTEGGVQVKYSPHFIIPTDGVDTDNKTVTIQLDQSNIAGGDGIEALQSGKTYEVDMKYHIKERDGKEATDAGATWGTLRVKITPKQTFPSLKQVGTAEKLYIGSTNKFFTFSVGKTTCQTAVFADAPVNIDTYGKTDYIKIADSASADIRRAFRVIDVTTKDGNDKTLFLTDQNGDYILDSSKNKIACANITVQMVQPSILVGGKTYTVPIEIRYKNQDKNTKGTIVNYKVTIVK